MERPQDPGGWGPCVAKVRAAGRVQISSGIFCDLLFRGKNYSAVCLYFLLKAFIVTEPGMDGCAGMMLLQEQNQCSTALITFRILILQVKVEIHIQISLTSM